MYTCGVKLYQSIMDFKIPTCEKLLTKLITFLSNSIRYLGENYH